MKRLTLGTLLALVASAILVAPGGAAKPNDAITCGPTTTTEGGEATHQLK